MTENDETQTIQPRTRAERQAFMDGWAEALKMARAEGISAAAGWWLEMNDLERP